MTLLFNKPNSFSVTINVSLLSYFSRLFISIFPYELVNTLYWIPNEYWLHKIVAMSRRTKVPWTITLQGSSLFLPILLTPFYTSKIWLKGTVKASVGGKMFVWGGCWCAREMHCLVALPQCWENWEGAWLTLVMRDSELMLPYFPSPSSTLLFLSLKFALQLGYSGSQMQEDPREETPWFTLS